MKIVQLIPTLLPGGAERIVLSLATQLRRRKHDVAIIAITGPAGTSLEAEALRTGVPVEFLVRKRWRWYDGRVVPRLTNSLGQRKPDVVHTHLSVLKYLWPASNFNRMAVVHTLHNVAHREVEAPARLIQGVLFRRGVVSVACAAAVADSMPQVYGMLPSFTINNGIDVSRYSEVPGARGEVRRELDIPSKSVVFVCVAGFRPEKNHALLVRAFASRAYRTGAYLLLAGEGELRWSVERQVRALGCADRVRFLGFRADVPRVLSGADVFVLASNREGNPLCVMEAMAAGKAVIATNVGGVPAIVTPRTGWLVSPGDEHQLAETMWRVAVDPGSAHQKGATAAEVNGSLVTDEAMAEAYEQIYRTLL